MNRCDNDGCKPLSCATRAGEAKRGRRRRRRRRRRRKHSLRSPFLVGKLHPVVSRLPALQRRRRPPKSGRGRPIPRSRPDGRQVPSRSEVQRARPILLLLVNNLSPLLLDHFQEEVAGRMVGRTEGRDFVDVARLPGRGDGGRVGGRERSRAELGERGKGRLEKKQALCEGGAIILQCTMHSVMH